MQTYRRERQTIEDRLGGREDFTNQWGLTAIRADRAYAQLELGHGAGTEPGSGQTVGLIDSGIDIGHPVFAGKTVTEHFFSGATDETGDERSHGTAVASVIAGRPSAAFTASVTAAHGVARGADVAMFAVPTSSSRGDYVPISLTGGNDTDDRWAARFTHVLDWSSGGRSLDFVNMSVGYKGIVEQYSGQELRSGLDATIAALAQTGIGEKTVFVWAAGNAHSEPCDLADFTGNPDLCVNGSVNAKSVEIMPGLPARIAELRGHMIAVVALGTDDRIASFSNRCGIAADWCLAAPGVRVRAAYFGPHPDDGSPGVQGAYDASGTSVAAPMVTGGLVAMKHYFRDQMPNTELVARLLATANKRGIYADSTIYGQGLMDLGAATAPVGITGVALSDRVDGPGSNVARTRFTSGSSLGNGLARALAGQEIAVFDALGAPFWFSLDDLAGEASRPSVAARLQSFMAPPRRGRTSGTLQPDPVPLTGQGEAVGPAPLRLGMLGTPPFGAGGGHLSLAGRALTLGATTQDGLSVAAFSTEGMQRQTPVSGATLSWQPDGSPLALTGGMVAERETVLGSTASGAFGRFSGSSAFAGIEGNARFGRWRLGAGVEIGTVDAAARGGMLARVSPLATSAVALRAGRKLADRDALTVSVGQPLRVEAGRAKLSIPIGRTKGGRVMRRSLTADLEPTGRQIDIAVQWRRPLAEGSEIRLGAGWSRQPGHDASAEPDLSVLAGWRHTF